MRRAAQLLATMAALALVLPGCGSAAKSGDVLAAFSSIQAAGGHTGRFAPPGAWDLEYSWTCSRARSEGIPDAKGIDLVVYNSDDQTTAVEHPELASPALSGKGVMHFQMPGDYYVGLQTKCDWDVSIVDRGGS